MTEKLTTTERYASTLEMACAEMKARLHSMQEQLNAVPMEMTADAIAYEKEKQIEAKIQREDNRKVFYTMNSILSFHFSRFKIS